MDGQKLQRVENDGHTIEGQLMLVHTNTHVSVKQALA